MKRLMKLMPLILSVFLMAFPVQVKAAENDPIVYVTKTGDKYHLDGCSYLRKSKIAISLSNAQKSHTPCTKCYAHRLTVKSAPAPASAFTGEMAVQTAYQTYMSSGLASDAAFLRTQQNVAGIAACKSSAEVVLYVKNDLSGAAPAATPVGGVKPAVTGAFTAEIAVQTAYQTYMNAGLASDAAFSRTQQNTASLVKCKSAEEVVRFVQSDLAGAKTALPSATKGTASGLTAEQIIQQAFTELVSGGMSPDAAFKQVQANLPALLATAGK
ncbi:MAG: hypothetical protein IJR00_09230 [Lachnospiraceae bacterium]|nr:hypothetical protein [Lachnospiraceae bacterium]